MGEGALTDWPKMTFVLEHEGPIPLAEFTLALQRLASRYARETKAHGHDEEERLYIAEIRKGSVVVDFVTAHPYAIPIAIVTGAVAVATGYNALHDFAKNLGILVGHFTGKRPATDISKADCDDMRALAAPVIQTLNAQISVTINNGILEPIFTLDEGEARAADNRAALERKDLEQRDENALSATLFVWDQVRNAPGIEEGRSPDRGIIQEIDGRARQVTFAADDIKQAMTRQDFNPFEKAFVVDAKVLIGPNGPAAYRITALHDVLERD